MLHMQDTCFVRDLKDSVTSVIIAIGTDEQSAQMLSVPRSVLSALVIFEGVCNVCNIEYQFD
jgi:hypothetical protein